MRIDQLFIRQQSIFFCTDIYDHYNRMIIYVW